MISQKKVTLWFTFILVGVGIGLGTALILHRVDATRISDFYTVTDSLAYRQSDHVNLTYLVQVASYDTSKILRAADAIAVQMVANPINPMSVRRDLLLLFFTASDTSALQPDEIEDLAYTNREQVSPATRLYAVRNGYRLKAQFPASRTSPYSSVVLQPNVFYRPRAGIRAADLQP